LQASFTPFFLSLMRVFVTGATGLIGSAVVQQLLTAGHQVVGLSRSPAADQALAAAGAAAHRGTLDDLASLRHGAAAADGVIHLAFPSFTSDPAPAGRTDRRAIEALGAALAGSGRPFVGTTGTMLLPVGQLNTEATPADVQSPGGFRVASEEAALALAGQGVRASVVRLAPSVHGAQDYKGFVPLFIDLARQKGVAAYMGDGANRWPAVHQLDAAQLFRLALEKGQAGACYHGVGDEGIPFRAIAEAIGHHLQVPIVSLSGPAAADHFGWLAFVAGIDSPASSLRTQQELGWQPSQPSLLADLAQGHYFQR
jgi:nucleoside-diphosphate-sugar epimerase